MNNNWQKVKLKEVSSLIKRGVTPKYVSEEGIIILNQKCIRDFQVTYDSAQLTDETKNYPEEKFLQNGDILICSTGVGTLGRVAQISNVNGKVLVDSHVSIIRANNRINKVFLGWILKKNQNAIEALAEGSTGQTELSRIKLEEFEIRIPESEIQNVISNILSSLDDKIELLKQQNKTLENIAQTLFKRWFVEFNFPDESGKPYKENGGNIIESELGRIPSDWKVGRLKEITTNKVIRFDGDNFIEKYPYLPIDLISAKSIALQNKPAHFSKAQSSLINFNEMDILFGAMRPYFHKVSVAPFDGLTRTTCLVLNAKNKMEYSFLLLTLFQDKTVEYATSHSEGSAIPYVKWNNGLENMTIVIPSVNITMEFNSIVLPIIENLNHSYFQISELNDLRNTLLPKLMNGGLYIE